jgi:hypothetical protein
MPTLQVDAEVLNVIAKRKPLAKMLRIIDDSSQGYTTRELLRVVKSWGEGHKMIKQAEKEGYITRREVKPEGKGNWRKYNVLTPKGKAIADLARTIGI